MAQDAYRKAFRIYLSNLRDYQSFSNKHTHDEEGEREMQIYIEKAKLNCLEAICKMEEIMEDLTAIPKAK